MADEEKHNEQHRATRLGRRSIWLPLVAAVGMAIVLVLLAGSARASGFTVLSSQMGDNSIDAATLEAAERVFVLVSALTIGAALVAMVAAVLGFIAALRGLALRAGSRGRLLTGLLLNVALLAAIVWLVFVGSL